MELKDAYTKIDNFCCSNHNSLQGNTVKYLNGREEKINMFADYQETKDDDFCKDANEMVEALETIKELIDLQEDLGCPLKALIKAIKDGIYATRRKWDGTESTEVFEKFDVTFDGYSLWNEDEYPYNYDEILKVSPICNEFRIYDYKKTWWLKEDKSE